MYGRSWNKYVRNIMLKTTLTFVVGANCADNIQFYWLKSRASFLHPRTKIFRFRLHLSLVKSNLSANIWLAPLWLDLKIQILTNFIWGIILTVLSASWFRHAKIVFWCILTTSSHSIIDTFDFNGVKQIQIFVVKWMWNIIHPICFKSTFQDCLYLVLRISLLFNGIHALKQIPQNFSICNVRNVIKFDQIESQQNDSYAKSSSTRHIYQMQLIELLKSIHALSQFISDLFICSSWRIYWWPFFYLY